MVKNFTLALGAAILLSTPAMAFKGLNQTNDVKREQNLKIEKTEIIKSRASQAEKHALRAPMKEGVVTDIIYDAEGESVTYSKSSAGMYLYWIYLMPYEDTVAANVVFGEDNNVYFLNIMSMGVTDSYAVGTIEDDKVVLSLPQTLLYYDDYGYGMNLEVLKLSEDGSTYEQTGIESVEYTYNPETKDMELVLPGDEYALGLVWTDDDTWTGYADYYQIYDVLTDEPNTVPDGVTLEEWVYSDPDGAHIMGVGITDDAIYLVGLDDAMPEGVVVATLDGNKATISQDQFVGIYYDQYFIYTKLVYPYVDEDGYDTYGLAPEDAVYELTVDLENKVISSVPDCEYELCLNAAKDYVYYLGIYFDFKVFYQSSFAGTPVAPYDLEVADYYEDYGSYDFSFWIPNTSTDGNMILYEYIYYRIYLDDDVLEIEDDGESYLGVEGLITEIPFDFTNGWDIYSAYGGSNRVVSVYAEGFSSLGVQTIYKYEGEVTESEISRYDFDESGVNIIENTDIVNSVYYDLNGRRVSNPDKGIYVIRQTLSDGNTVTRKVVRR